MIVLVNPPPAIVIVPVLAAPMLALTSIKIVPLPVPLDGDTVSHEEALLDAAHDTLDVIVTDVPPASDGGVQDVFDTSNLDDDAAAALCTTVIVLVIPPPVIVTVPVLPDVEVFAVTLTVMLPLPVPLEGEIVSHDAALLDAVHDTLDVIDAVVFAAVDNGVHEATETTSEGVGVGGVGVGGVPVPSWVTVMDLVMPPPEIVIVPVRAAPVFALTSI